MGTQAFWTLMNGTLTRWCHGGCTFKRSPAWCRHRGRSNSSHPNKIRFTDTSGGRVVPCFAKLSLYWWPRLKLAKADGQPMMTRPDGNPRQKNPVLSASDRKLGPMSTMDCLCQINGNQLEANITRNTFVLCWTFQIVNVATVLSSTQITDNWWRWSVADGEGRRTADRTHTLNCCQTFTYIHCVRMMT